MISFLCKSALAAGIGLLSFWASTAGVSAQTITDLESAVTQGAQYEDAQRQAEQFRLPEEEEAILDREPGVFVLKVNEIFTIGAAAGLGHSTNPGRTLDINAEESGFSNFALSAGVNTLVGGHVDAGVNLVVSGTDYFENDDIDNSNAIVTAYVGKSVLNDRVNLSLGANYGVSGDSDFSETTEFYGVTAQASSLFRVRENLFIRPALSVSRQLSDNEAQDSTAATAAVRAIWSPAQKWRVGAEVSYTDRSYDNFYEDVTFVERQDDVWSASLSVSRSFGPDLEATASVGYTDQSSAFFLSEYEAVDSGLSVRLSKRF